MSHHCARPTVSDSIINECYDAADPSLYKAYNTSYCDCNCGYNDMTLVRIGVLREILSYFLTKEEASEWLEERLVELGFLSKEEAEKWIQEKIEEIIIAGGGGSGDGEGSGGILGSIGFATHQDIYDIISGSYVAKN